MQLAGRGAHEDQIAWQQAAACGFESVASGPRDEAVRIAQAESISADIGHPDAAPAQGHERDPDAVEAVHGIPSVKAEPAADQFFRLACEAVRKLIHRGCG